MPQSYEFDRLLIGGAWETPQSPDRIDVVDPSTEAVIGHVPRGGAGDVDRAVRAARDAFAGWSGCTTDERAGFLRALREGIRESSAELAEAITREMGAPIKMSTRIQVGLPQMTLGAILDGDGVKYEEEIGNSLVLREPIGVVGCITPWNYPLHQIVNKLGPALLAGCTLVLKPSEVAPFDAFLLGRLVEDAGIPAGVVNIVSGYGPEVGEAIASHPGVDMVSFTGSTRAGRRVAALASDSVKRVALELGGKSASVVLDDADLTKAVGATVKNCYLNSGQTCTALTRLLVPRGRLVEAEETAAATASSMRAGDPLDEATQLGPLSSEAQRDRVRSYIAKGVEEGARLVTGGAEAPDDLPTGFHVRATVFSDVDTRMTIAQEEIFGPVLSILPYDGEDEAVRIANDTQYGLAGAVWSGDSDHAVAVARRLRTGQVDINGGAFNPAAPFGGYRQSGLGRELGRFGVEEFLEVKSLQL
jgi:betaine-aldehyde dehydrogenase